MAGQDALFLMLRVLVLLRVLHGVLGRESQFHMVDGYLCISSQYTESYTEIRSKVSCASACDLNQRCRAFTLADGPCQLFAFDECSKSVRDCSCSRRGQVFVKQQPGLEPGSLCPSGYGMELCGVKYRLFTDQSFWRQSREKCEAQSGLVIMADVVDASEMDHVNAIYSNFSVGLSIWLGGYQTPGSPEPGGGWYWVGCNTTVDPSLWGSGEPLNDYYLGESAICKWHLQGGKLGFSDFYENFEERNYLCECVSPFN